MWLRKSDKIVLLVLMLLLTTVVWSQQAIKNVSIEKVTPTQFRIKYQLIQNQRYDFNTVIAKIFRKRSGKIEEIFSDDITPFNFKAAGPAFSYHWIIEPGMVTDGDELQAKLILSFNKTSVSKLPARGKKNKPPTANAGNFIDVQLPITTPLVLNGSKSFDSDGSIIQYNWKQIGGPGIVTITKKDSAKAFVNGPLLEGSYAFELTVKDQHGESGKDRMIMSVRPPAVIISPPPVVTTKPVEKENTAIKPLPVSYSPGKMKGGPANALLNIALPGVGHYFVSGDHHGKGRKPIVLAITALYAGSLGTGFYFLRKSDDMFNKYNNLANFREYQKDAAGNIIGVRGGNEEDAMNLLASAKTAHQNAILFFGAGAGILAADFTYTFIKGLQNKKKYKKEAAGQAGLFFTSDGTQVTAGVRLKL